MPKCFLSGGQNRLAAAIIKENSMTNEREELLERDAYTKAGNILGIYFPRVNVVEMWQYRNYYQQQEWQMTTIADLTRGTLKRYPPLTHEGGRLSMNIKTGYGLNVGFSFGSAEWQLDISAQTEPPYPTDVVIRTWKDYYACAKCNTINMSPHEHNPSPQGVHFYMDGLWRFNEKQRNELALILEVITLKPYDGWKIAVGLAHARQLLERQAV